MFDDQHRVARFHELVEDFDEPAHILKVKPGCGLIEDIEGPPGGALGELSSEFDALGFAPREGGGGLAQVEVVEPHSFEHAQGAGDLWMIGESLKRFPDGQFENIGDGKPLVAHSQGGFIETLPLAFLAAHEHIGEKVHLDLANPIALAGFAASALDVEREAPGLVTIESGFGKLREETTDFVEDLDVGDRVAAGGAPDGPLIDVDDLVEAAETRNAPVCPDSPVGGVQLARERRKENRIDERGFPGARDTRNRRHHAQGDFHVHIAQVVFPGAQDLDRSAGGSPLRGDRDGSPPGQVVAGE